MMVFKKISGFLKSILRKNKKLGRIEYLKKKYFFFRDFSNGTLNRKEFIEYLELFKQDLINDIYFPFTTNEIEKLKEYVSRMIIALGKPVNIENIIANEDDDIMTLDTLIGVGGTHLHDIYAFTQDILRSVNLDLITIEASIGFQTIRPRGWKIPKISEGKVRIRKIQKPNTGQTEYFINDQSFISLRSIDCPNAALEYALKSGVPVYFVDNPLKDDKNIVGIEKIKDNMYNYIKLTLHQPIGKFAPNNSDRGFDPRNKFMAWAIVYLFNHYKAKKIAHVGGNSHFTYEWYSPTGVVPNFSSTTIQELVNPKNFYYNGTRGRVKVL